MEPDNFSYSIMIKGVKNMARPNVELALKFFNQYLNDFDYKDIIIFNSILDVLVNYDNFDKANEIYLKIPQYPELTPDQITFNTLIKGACKIKNFEIAHKYFIDMRKIPIKPNRITYNSLMDLTVKLKNMKMALYFVDQMQKDDISPDGFTYSIILHGLKLNESSP